MPKSEKPLRSDSVSFWGDTTTFFAPKRRDGELWPVSLLLIEGDCGAIGGIAITFYYEEISV